MKEFKKWWDNQFSSRKGNNNSHIGYPEAYQAWKAALKYVQSRLEFGSDVAYSEADILMAIKKEIREELGE